MSSDKEKYRLSRKDNNLDSKSIDTSRSASAQMNIDPVNVDLESNPKSLANDNSEASNYNLSSKEKRNKPKQKSELEYSPHLQSLSAISERERLGLNEILSSVLKNPGLIGVIKSRNGFGVKNLLPVAFIEGNNEAIILRNLDVSSSMKKELQNIISIQNILLPLEEISIFDASEGFIYVRSFTQLTLNDLLASKTIVNIESLLRIIFKILSISSALFKNNFIHGHIHPGNIIYKGIHEASFLDYGIASLTPELINKDESFAPEFGKAEISSSLDSFGLGYTIKRILDEVRLQNSDSSPLLETIQSSFSPLITALTNINPDKRPNPEIAKLMFLDILPMISRDFDYKSVEINVIKNFEKLGRYFPSNISAIDEGDKSSTENNTENNSEELIGDLLNEDLGYPFSESDSLNNLDPISNISINDDMISLDLDNTGLDNTEAEYNHLKKQSTRFSNLVFFSLLCVLAFIIYSGRDIFYSRFESFISSLGNISEDDISKFEISEDFDGPFLGYESLKTAWSSQIPSRMKLVARQAVYESQYRAIAEQVILTALKKNEINSELVDKKLLRVAFNDQWEDQLDDFDRRYALSLGLIRILKDTLPPGLGEIEDRHPIILLSILSAANENTSSVLKRVSADKLIELPSPYGTAFQILLSGRKEVNCSSSDVRLLSQLSTRGVESTQTLQEYLAIDNMLEFQRRLSALSVVFSFSSEIASKAMTIMLNDSKFLDNQLISWGRRVKLDTWNNFDPIDLMFLLSGVPIRNSNDFDIVKITDLMLHPIPEIRKFAIQNSRDKIELKHPAGFEIVNYIENNPQIISGDQLVSLFAIMHDPDKTYEEKKGLIISFIDSKPDLNITEKLLLGTSKSKSSSPLDALLLMYLSESSWSPDLASLLKLSEHPDKVTRMFAYKKIFELDDKDNALLLLKSAYEKESVNEFKDQLKDLISALSVN